MRANKKFFRKGLAISAVLDEATQQGMASVTGALAGLNLPGGLGL